MVNKTITTHILFNITWSWGNSKWSAVYFQYILIALYLAYNKYKLYKTLDYWSGNSFSTPFCLWFFKKHISHVIFYYWPNFIVWLPSLLEILGNMCIAIVCSGQYTLIALNLAYNKYKLYKTLDYWSGNSFSTTFCLWFFKKHVSHVIFYYWPNFIVWLPSLLEIMGNMCITILCFPGCGVIDFENNLMF